MYLCPISFQGMHKGDSHMHVFLDPQDNNTKHEYYTPQEILDGTEDHIKEMMYTDHKNRTDRHNKEQESGGVPAAKRQKQQSLLNFTVRSAGAAVVSFLVYCCFLEACTHRLTQRRTWSTSIILFWQFDRQFDLIF